MTEFERQVADALRLLLMPAENVEVRKTGAIADWYTVHGGDIARIASRVAAAITAAVDTPPGDTEGKNQLHAALAALRDEANA